MRRHLAWLFFLGCSPTPAQKAPDIQLPIFDASAVQIDAGPAPVSVTVFLGGAPEPGVLVAFQDASGAVLGTATTDKKGTASRVLPAGSQVTVLLGSAATTLAIYTYVGVEPGDALAVVDPTVAGSLVTAIVDALPPNPPAATATFLGHIGTCTTYFGQTPAAMYAWPECVNNGKFPLLVLAQGGSGPPSLGYAFQKDNTITDPDAGTASITVSGNWSTTVGTWTIDASNVPTSATVSASFAEIANGIPDALAGVPPASFETHPGYADFVQSEVVASFPPGNIADVQMASIATRAPTPALDGNVTIDLGQLLPAITGASADFATDPARPTVSWKTGGSLASADGTFVRVDCMHTDDAALQTSVKWQLVVPPSATSVQVPALPPEADAWTSSGVGLYSTPTVVTVDGLGGYAQLRKLAATVPPPDVTAKTSPPFIPPLPKDGTVRLTLYGPSPD